MTPEQEAEIRHEDACAPETTGGRPLFAHSRHRRLLLHALDATRAELETARAVPSIHPSDCQSCSEDDEPCATHADDLRYWRARVADAEAEVARVLKLAEEWRQRAIEKRVRAANRGEVTGMIEAENENAAALAFDWCAREVLGG